MKTKTQIRFVKLALATAVIIDWHDHNAHEHTDEAVAFFTKMAMLYGDKPNVIYEILTSQ